MINALLYAVVGIFMLVGTGFATVGVEHMFFAPEAPAVSEEVVTTNGGETPQPQNTATTPTNTSAAANPTTDCVATTRGDDDDEEDDDDRVTQNCATTTTPAVTPTVSPAAPKPTTQPAVQTPGTFTMAQIAAHNSAASCYSAISGSVYNLTSFVSKHPGGAAAIKSLCGVDGTTAYNTQHGGASRPASELAPLKIGTLIK